MFPRLTRVAIGVAAFAALLVAGTVITWRVWNDRSMGRSISGWVSSPLTGRGGPRNQAFTIESVHWPYAAGLRSLFFGTATPFEAWNFGIYDAEGNEVIFTPHMTGRIMVGKTVWSVLSAILRKEQDVEVPLLNVVIDTPRAMITPLSSGKVNLITAFLSKKPRPAGEVSRGGIRITVDDATIRDGRYAMAFAGWHAEVDGLKAHVEKLYYSSFPGEQEPDRPAFRWRVDHLEAARGMLTMGSFEFPLDGLRATRFEALDPTRQHLSFGARTVSHGAHASVVGRLTDIFSDHPGVDATLDFDHGRDLADLVHARALIGGDIHGEVRFKGPFSTVVIDGEADGGEFSVAQLTAKNVHGRFKLSGQVINLSDLRADLGGGHIDGMLDLDLEGLAWKAHLTTHGVDPARLDPLVPPEMRNVLAGQFDATADADGSLAIHPERVRVRGIEGKLTRSRRDVLPHVVGLRGGAGLSPDRIRLDGLRIDGDGLAGTFRGELDAVRRTINSQVVVQGRGLGGLLRRADLPGAVDGITAHAKVQGSLLKPVIDGTAHLAGVGISDRRLSDVDAHIHFQNGLLDATDLRGRGFGGSVVGTLRVGLFDGPFTRLLATPTLSLHAIAENLRINTVLSLPTVRGEFSGQIDVEGDFAHPRGSASLALPEVSIVDDPYRNGIFKADIDEHGLDISQLELTRVGGGKFSIEPHGHVGLDGSLDVNVLPRNFPLDAIPQLRNAPVALDGLLSGAVHLGGALGRWIPEGLIEVVNVKIRDALFHDGQLRLKPEGNDDIRVTGVFFKRFQVDGHLRIVPHVAGDVTISFDGLPLVDLIPELRKLAEVQSVASGWARFGFDINDGLTKAELHLSKLLVTFIGDDAAPADSGVHASDQLLNDGDVVITSDGKSLSFDKFLLRYEGSEGGVYGRIGSLAITGNLAPESSNLAINGDVELRFLEYIASGLFQHTHGRARAGLRLTGHAALPRIAGTLELDDARIEPRGADRLFRVPEGTLVFDEHGISLPTAPRFRVQLDGAEATADGHLDMNWDDWIPTSVALNVNGELSATLLAWIFPDQVSEPTGRFGVALKVGGRFPHPSWEGALDVRQMSFHTKKLGRDVRMQSGTAMIRDFDVWVGCPEDSPIPSCRAVQALVDDTSLVRMNGTMSFAHSLLSPHLSRIRMHADGDNLEWGTAGVSQVTLSPRVDLVGSGDALTLSGTVNLVTGRYYQNFDFVRDLIFQPRFEERDAAFYKGIPVLENMGLDLYASASGSLFIKNNLADLNVTMNPFHIAGTLGAPTLDGTFTVEPGGRFTIPLLRSEFISEQGTITFEQNEPFPSRTPRLEIHASTDWQDRYDQLHHINLTVRGTYKEPDLDLSSTDGWDKSHVLAALVTGGTADDIRRSALDVNAKGSSSTSDGYIKSLTGRALQPIEDPLRQATKLDLVRLELGYDSVLIKLCIFNKPGFKLCGNGDVGFVSTTRVDARGELKLSDFLSIVGGVEHVEHGVDTTEDVLTRGKLQLTFRGPLF